MKKFYVFTPGPVEETVGDPDMTGKGAVQVAELRSKLPAEEGVEYIISGLGYRHQKALQALGWLKRVDRFAGSVGRAELVMKRDGEKIVRLASGWEVSLGSCFDVFPTAEDARALLSTLPDGAIICADSALLEAMGAERWNALSDDDSATAYMVTTDNVGVVLRVDVL